MKSKDICWKKQYVLIGIGTSIVFFFVRDYIKNHFHDVHILWNSVSLLYYISLVLTVIVGYKLLSKQSRCLPYKGFSVIGAYSYELYLVHGYANSVIVMPATMIMVTEFALICIIGSYLLNKLNKYIKSSINRLIKLK